jgi:exonuclease VII small subunit
MRFVDTSIGVIKSISQRSLALAWRDAAKGAAFSSFANFKPPARGHDPRYMVIWNVESNPADRTFRAMYQGDFIAVSFRERWEGRSMADVIPASLRTPALAAANHCAETGCGVYMVYRASNERGQSIDCERLVLPFGKAETGVRQLVTSMETISLEGDVILDSALDYFTAGYEVVLAAQFNLEACERRLASSAHG